MKRNLSLRMPGLVALILPLAAPQEWKPAEGPLRTRWAADVSPAAAHPEYPRPQMVRRDWANLNGLWSYAIVARDAARPEEAAGEILVPFPVESALSGAMRRVSPAERLWCWRTFDVPAGWGDRRVLLHFGAVDWEAEVWVDGHAVGTHRGGYDPFFFDITTSLGSAGPHEVVVAAWDPTDAGTQPRGKQVQSPGGIWYTPTTGMWRTVWLEPVPLAAIERLRMTPDVDSGTLHLEVTASGLGPAETLQAVARGGGELVVRELAPGTSQASPGEPVALDLRIPAARPWSPSDPFLYDLTVSIRRGEATIDAVESYFGLREIGLGTDATGARRLLLNGAPLFQYGPLDQGFWPDGLYTAPTDAALRYDLEMTKRLGFNMVRKHVKVEPDRWYYWCDRLGLLVWQDMPSGDEYIGGDDPDIQRTPESGAQFELELQRNIDALANHPCIVMWVPYNEGWGQWDTPRIVDWIARHDPTRLVNGASGWTDRGVGDVNDIHAYPGPAMPPLEERRAVVLGEFGGLGLPLPGHTWQAERNWGYRSFDSPAALTEAYVTLLANLRPLIARGLCAAVYTQTTDVEIEVNGLLSYDREIVKIDEARAAEAARKLFLPPPVQHAVLPTSEAEGQTWRYTTAVPAEGWTAPGFDDSGWTEGPGGFGTEGTPGAVVRTRWSGPDLWLRRRVELPAAADPRRFFLSIHHDEEAVVYCDGVEIARLPGYTTAYALVSLGPEARNVFRAGAHTIAVHCHQTGGGQYIDLGLVEVREEGE
ncbi:MAG: sugar-binding domain-containing protein [Planctomycetota bacterium]